MSAIGLQRQLGRDYVYAFMILVAMGMRPEVRYIPSTRHDSFDPSAYSRQSAYGAGSSDRQRSTAARMTQRDYTLERKRRKRKKVIDKMAAVFILQGWLDSQS